MIVIISAAESSGFLSAYAVVPSIAGQYGGPAVALNDVLTAQDGRIAIDHDFGEAQLDWIESMVGAAEYQAVAVLPGDFIPTTLPL